MKLDHSKPLWGVTTFVLLVCGGCVEDSTALVVELVPNPEVNTRDQVQALVNRLDVVLDAEGGFVGVEGDGGDVGPFSAEDVDGDGDMELVLTRPGGRSLEPFELTPGQQGDRLIGLTARGLDTGGGLAALGGEQGAFSEGEHVRVEVPFNLMPDRRPLKVISMTPRNGSGDLEAPVDSVTVELGGDVLESALIGHLLILATSFEPPVELEPSIVVSQVETGLGRVTTVRTISCPLPAGAYRVVVDQGVCARAGQCLDQSFSIPGQQDFEGAFTVAGEPEYPPGCTGVEVMAHECPEASCPEGFECDSGSCQPMSESPSESPGVEDVCDESLCSAPDNVCDGSLCVPDCRLWGACADPALHCQQDDGLCR